MLFRSTIVTRKPVFGDDRVFTTAQLARQALFREAAAYARAARHNPVYARLALGTPRNAYNLAISDWLHPPEILAMDLAAWDGQAGQIIRVKACDDVLVTGLTVAIIDIWGSVLERGPATQVSELWWEYTTRSAAGPSARVLACAQDLPGHTVQLERTK